MLFSSMLKIYQFMECVTKVKRVNWQLVLILTDPHKLNYLWGNTKKDDWCTFGHFEIVPVG